MATPTSVEILTPVQAQSLRVAPFGDVSQIYTALQLTLGDEAGQLHEITLDADGAIGLLEMILNRLHEAGDERATRIVNILRPHFTQAATYRRAA